MQKFKALLIFLLPIFYEKGLVMKYLLLIVLTVIQVLFSVAAFAEMGTVLTWQNKSGYWFACGPVQCLLAGWKSEAKVIDLVTHDSHQLIYVDQYGRCKRYSASNVRSYELSSDKVHQKAEC